MPAFAPHLQKNFKLKIEDGLPQATIEDIGGIYWLKCCPLCGCTHQVLVTNKDLPYKPICQTLPLVYKAQQVTWRKLYPDVAQYITLHLIMKE